MQSQCGIRNTLSAAEAALQPSLLCSASALRIVPQQATAVCATFASAPPNSRTSGHAQAAQTDHGGSVLLGLLQVRPPLVLTSPTCVALICDLHFTRFVRPVSLIENFFGCGGQSGLVCIQELSAMMYRPMSDQTSLHVM